MWSYITALYFLILQLFSKAHTHTCFMADSHTTYTHTLKQTFWQENVVSVNCKLLPHTPEVTPLKLGQHPWKNVCTNLYNSSKKWCICYVLGEVRKFGVDDRMLD